MPPRRNTLQETGENGSAENPSRGPKNQGLTVAQIVQLVAATVEQVLARRSKANSPLDPRVEEIRKLQEEVSTDCRAPSHFKFPNMGDYDVTGDPRSTSRGSRMQRFCISTSIRSSAESSSRIHKKSTSKLLINRQRWLRLTTSDHHSDGLTFSQLGVSGASRISAGRSSSKNIPSPMTEGQSSIRPEPSLREKKFKEEADTWRYKTQRKNDRKVRIAEESTKSWADIDSDSSSNSSSSRDNEQEEVQLIKLQMTRKLSHTFEEVKAENDDLKNSSAEPSAVELGEADSLKIELSKLTTENDLLISKSSELETENERYDNQ
ncbi:hypothetical protein F511_27119 [Dorcoceras hygrometricum]|uniref:Uncharacterized protein n=1 Tax=Dorcoceras hygrometricum TaxID=472368 RepID=A0A2Z7CHF3_9LAMI|nr:hypothetical protein F511_27119 [Dorcoceras hygrometricum]